MNKFAKIFVALLAATALATPAFAVTADVTGFLQVRGMAWDNSQDFNDDLDDNSAGVDQRFRLFTNAALNENVKAVFGFEVDSVWGSTGAGKQVGAMGTDAKGELEIKHLYLDFNIPGANTNVKAGSQYFKLGGGFIIADDAAGLQVRLTPAQGQSILLAWVKPAEGDDAKWQDDSDYYHLQYDGTFGGFKVSPYVGYYDINNASTSWGVADDGSAFYYGVDLGGKFGPVALSATLLGNDWELNDTTDGSGYAALVKAAFTTGAVTLSAEGAYYGDDDTSDGQFFSLRQGAATGLYNNFSEIVTGGRFDVRSSLNSTQRGADAPYIGNYLYGKLGAEIKASDKDKISAYYIYSESAEEGTAGAATNPNFGHELDLYYDRAIVPGLTFTVGGGYLMASDDLAVGADSADDAWKVGTAVTYTF